MFSSPCGLTFPLQLLFIIHTNTSTIKAPLTHREGDSGGQSGNTWAHQTQQGHNETQ